MPCVIETQCHWRVCKPVQYSYTFLASQNSEDLQQLVLVDCDPLLVCQPLVSQYTSTSTQAQVKHHKSRVVCCMNQTTHAMLKLFSQCT